MSTELAIKTPTPNISLSGNVFQSEQSFALAQRMAQALASSTIVPKDYQGNLGNCLIALEMSVRINTSPLMVMQNLYIVNGRPAWSSQFIVAMINSSKKYKTELQYEITGTGDKMECYAYAEDYNGHRVVGPVISMDMAHKEGWVSKNGSKWKTMPEVMIRYRAASFFGRLNCPDMIMGIYSVDEAVELSTDEYQILDIVSEVEKEIGEKANQEVLEEVEVLAGPAETKAEVEAEAEQETLGPDF